MNGPSPSPFIWMSTIQIGSSGQTIYDALYHPVTGKYAAEKLKVLERPSSTATTSPATLAETKAYYEAYFTPERLQAIETGVKTYTEFCKAEEQREANSQAWIVTGAAPQPTHPLPLSPVPMPGFQYSSGLFTPF